MSEILCQLQGLIQVLMFLFCQK